MRHCMVSALSPEFGLCKSAKTLEAIARRIVVKAVVDISFCFEIMFMPVFFKNGTDLF